MGDKDKVKRSKADKVLCQKMLEDQLLTYVINKELNTVFQFDDMEEQGNNLASPSM